MSLRVIGRLFLETAAYLGLIESRVTSLLRFNVGVALKRSNVRLSQNFIVRVFREFTNTSNLLRPFSTTLHFQKRHLHSTSPKTNFQPWIHVKQTKFPFLDHVKNVFLSNQRYNAALISEKYSQGLDNYDIGKFIAVGCNAAVYELKLKSDDNKNYPLALKILFNYDFCLPERIILRDMISELVPLADMPSNLKQVKMGQFKPLKRAHPNVVRLYTAFIDRFPSKDAIERAELFFPEALPSADMFGSLIDEPKTLFVVMKRYRMTLREYLLMYDYNYWCGRVMLGQLLEALVFLYEDNVSHRDLKSDNLLVNFDEEGEIPHLVVSDFGSSQTASFTLFYDNELTDLGGNLSLRPPEIRRALPGTLLNYHLADTWAAATIGYEIFTRLNPFYSRLSSETYSENELPRLPQYLHPAIKSVIYQMLRVDPDERPMPHVAANVVVLSLFRLSNDLTSILRSYDAAFEKTAANLQWSGNQLISKMSANLEKKVNDIIGLFASETITANLIAPSVVSRAEMQLRATFLARVDKSQVWSSLKYFMGGSMFENCSTTSSTSGRTLTDCN